VSTAWFLRAWALPPLLATLLLLVVGPSVAHSSVVCQQRIVDLAGEPPQAPLEPYLWRVRASHLGCAEALRVARRYMKRHRQGGWTCGSTHFETGCRRGDASIHLRALHPIGRSCGKLGFEPNSDNVATGIRASRVACSTARKLVRAVYEETDRFGFRCRSRTYQPIGLPYVHWVCLKGKQRVRWIKA
jgi:hypothetical protein